MALTSQFQDKLNCHVFRTLGWHHTSRMETCFSAVWSPWPQQTSIWWSPSTRWNHRTVMWIIKYHHNPPSTYEVRSKWVKMSILRELSLYAFDFFFFFSKFKKSFDLYFMVRQMSTNSDSYDNFIDKNLFSKVLKMITNCFQALRNLIITTLWFNSSQESCPRMLHKL